MAVRRSYRVHTPMRAVYATGSCKGFISVPTGAILVMVRGGHEAAMYVKVQWDNRELLVFPQDLSERAFECELPPRLRRND